MIDYKSFIIHDEILEKAFKIFDLKSRNKVDEDDLEEAYFCMFFK